MQLLWSASGHKKYSKFMAMSGTASDKVAPIPIQTNVDVDHHHPDVEPITPFNFEPDAKPAPIIRSRSQAQENELMQWHVRLDHLPFNKIK